MFEKQCQDCGITQQYKTKASLNRAIKNNSGCSSCAFKGSNNPFYGRKHSTDTKILISSGNLRSPVRNPLTVEEIDAVLTRECPKCTKIICYSSRGAYFRAEDNKSAYLSCTGNGENNPFFNKHHTQATKAAISNAVKGKRRSPTTEFTSIKSQGSHNSMFGKSVYIVWLGKYGKEEADKKLAELKVKRSENSRGARNPMYGKPAPQGSGNGWKGWYKGWFFRSLRELAYALYLDEQKLSWRGAETKDLRVEYTDPLGTARTYVADFLVENKYLVEIKPLKLKDTPLVKAKQKAAEAFCIQKGLVYQLKDMAKLEDKEIKRLYDSGIIQFTSQYEALYQRRCALWPVTDFPLPTR